MMLNGLNSPCFPGKKTTKTLRLARQPETQKLVPRPTNQPAEPPRCQAEARIRAIDGTANDTFQKHMAQCRGTSDIVSVIQMDMYNIYIYIIDKPLINH